MLRFTISDMLWLMSLVAMGGAWFVDHRRQVEIVRREKAANVESAQVQMVDRKREQAARGVPYAADIFSTRIAAGRRKPINRPR